MPSSDTASACKSRRHGLDCSYDNRRICNPVEDVSTYASYGDAGASRGDDNGEDDTSSGSSRCSGDEDEDEDSYCSDVTASTPIDSTDADSGIHGTDTCSNSGPGCSSAS